ncbi:hypothetical protein LMJ53_05555 [Rheinheimera sp. UJ51]|uniref:hypothetical protein n=1 Tax=Rheinheimera sp. UJ51 TaxID=2892446 RepID=UPI001E28AE98|nr:hypothetical protein [Rheinheimera sp. UJ51]MCC5451196.1 hypothetical protein [Rheinheimera sp. UJ51]
MQQHINQTRLENTLKFEHAHPEIMLRFSCEEQRNAIFGHVSTLVALVFLQQLGSSF